MKTRAIMMDGTAAHHHSPRVSALWLKTQNKVAPKVGSRKGPRPNAAKPIEAKIAPVTAPTKLAHK